MKNTLLAWTLILLLCSLVVACSGPLTEKDSSKGTIVINFGGAPETSRAATMGNLQYIITLVNLDIPGDDGTGYGAKSGTSFRVTVDPGNYRIVIIAELNGAYYAAGETTTPVQVTAGSNSSVTITLTVNIYAYLSESASSSAIDLPLAIALSASRWEGILDAIGNLSKQVNLDLSLCVSGGTFDPTPGSSAGKGLITSLILPNDATAIQAGTSASSPAFDGFSSLSTLDISGIQTIGDYAFSNLGLNVTPGSGVKTIGRLAFRLCSLEGTISFPDSLVEIGEGAFMDNNLTSVTIPANAQIGDGAFDYNNDLLDITIGSGCVLGSGAFNNYWQATRVVIGAGGITYSGTTGILGDFDSFADPSGSGHIPEGTYTWKGTTWEHTA
jgi:hypothetical protein